MEFGVEDKEAVKTQEDKFCFQNTEDYFIIYHGFVSHNSCYLPSMKFNCKCINYLGESKVLQYFGMC